jgi:hypothetical protein
VNEALLIRPFAPADWPGVWRLLEPVFRAEETFPNDPAITETEAWALWVEQSQAVMVAVTGGHLCAGSLVRTTAEPVVGLLPEWRFSQE